jgi:hypothetical protein
MSELTLQATKKIIKALNEYSGKSMDFESIMKYVRQQTSATQGDVALVIEFLQELQVSTAASPVSVASLASRVDMETPLDLANELSYNYQVAKAILQETLEQDAPDKEDLRKTLTTIQKYMDSMLKMQEKVFNVQQMQRFQEAVMEILSTHDLKEVIVARLLEVPL